MKMSNEHFETLKETCDAVIETAAKNLGCTREEVLDRAVRCEGVKENINDPFITVRWKIFYACERELKAKYNKSFVETLHEYLNDNHIDTALKKAIPELQN